MLVLESYFMICHLSHALPNAYKYLLSEYTISISIQTLFYTPFLSYAELVVYLRLRVWALGL